MCRESLFQVSDVLEDVWRSSLVFANSFIPWARCVMSFEIVMPQPTFDSFHNSISEHVSGHKMVLLHFPNIQQVHVYEAPCHAKEIMEKIIEIPPLVHSETNDLSRDNGTEPAFVKLKRNASIRSATLVPITLRLKFIAELNKSSFANFMSFFQALLPITLHEAIAMDVVTSHIFKVNARIKNFMGQASCASWTALTIRLSNFTLT